MSPIAARWRYEPLGVAASAATTEEGVWGYGALHEPATQIRSPLQSVSLAHPPGTAAGAAPCFWSRISWAHSI
jgi:hypothetical protein